MAGPFWGGFMKKGLVKKLLLPITIVAISLILAILFYQYIAFIGIIIALGIFFYHSYQDAKEKPKPEVITEIIRIIEKDEDAEKRIKTLEKMIKNPSVTIFDLIKKFRKPIYTLVIYKWYEETQRKIVDLLSNDLGFERLGNGLYILPPSKLNYPYNKPPEQKWIENWFKRNIKRKIPEDYKYVVHFMALVNIRHIFSERRFSKQDKTALEILTKDEVFLKHFLSTVEEEYKSTKEIIKEERISLLITDYCTDAERRRINEENNKIMKKLNCKNLFDVSTKTRREINEVIKGYCKRDFEVTDNIYNNAQMLKGLLY